MIILSIGFEPCRDGDVFTYRFFAVFLRVGVSIRHRIIDEAICIGQDLFTRSRLWNGVSLQVFSWKISKTQPAFLVILYKLFLDSNRSQSIGFRGFSDCFIVCAHFIFYCNLLFFLLHFTYRQFMRVLLFLSCSSGEASPHFRFNTIYAVTDVRWFHTVISLVKICRKGGKAFFNLAFF